MNPEVKLTAPSSRQQPAQSKVRLTPAEKLTAEEVATLRLDAGASTDFEKLREQIRLSREGLQSFDGEDVSGMDDARHDLFSAARNRMARDNTALVHFLAPRVMKLRDGEAKRKWRSFVTKLQKDTKLI